MRFTNGKYNERHGDGLNGTSHWSVVFDDQEDKSEHLKDLISCAKKYDLLIKDICDTLNKPSIVPAIIPKGEQAYHTKGLIKFLQEKSILETLISATFNPNDLEFDYVFITQRDQGVGRFLKQGPYPYVRDISKRLKPSNLNLDIKHHGRFPLRTWKEMIEMTYALAKWEAETQQ